ncbi:MAG: PilN domain-containing protein [Candidatus Omnitrophota bacterium]
MEHFLGAKLGVSIEKINPFSLFKPSSHIRNHKKSLLSDYCSFTSAAGLAAAKLIKKQENIDLLPEKKKNPAQVFMEKLKEKPVKAAVAALCCLVLLISFQTLRAGVYKREMDLLAKTVKSVQKQLSRKQSDQLKLAQDESELLSKQLMLQSRLSLLSKSIRKPDKFSDVFAKVAVLLPKEIWVDKLSYSDKKLTITGSGSNTEIIMNLIEKLRGSNDFVDATFNYSQKEPDAEIYRFEVTANIKDIL